MIFSCACSETNVLYKFHLCILFVKISWKINGACRLLFLRSPCCVLCLSFLACLSLLLVKSVIIGQLSLYSNCIDTEWQTQTSCFPADRSACQLTSILLLFLKLCLVLSKLSTSRCLSAEREVFVNRHAPPSRFPIRQKFENLMKRELLRRSVSFFFC